MKVNEMRDLSGDELEAKISEARRSIVDLRFQLAARKLETPSDISYGSQASGQAANDSV